MIDEVAIELDTDVTEGGDVVTGVVRWGPLDDVPAKVVVRLRYRTEGRGASDTEVVDEVIFAGSASGAERIELSVPVNGPMSFDGSLVKVLWELDLSLDHRLAGDRGTTVGLTVLPRGGLALWARQAGTPPRP
jgi:hypothetical protein